MCAKEVAEARADVHGQAISAINDRERRIAEEHNRLNQLKDDLAKAHSAVGTEANQKELKKPHKGNEPRLSLRPNNPCRNRVL